MKHRSFALIFSVILVAFLASAISCKSDKSLKHCTFDAIPENSDFIIKTSDIDSVTSIIGKGNPLFDIIYLPKTGQKDMICNIADSIKSAG
ncbi:MAG: hypothetical protein HUK15_07160, partial [Bacteroidales bacterium]|nr:hypothetical protein [Bacteroidales bacterium]